MSKENDGNVENSLDNILPQTTSTQKLFNSSGLDIPDNLLSEHKALDDDFQSLQYFNQTGVNDYNDVWYKWYHKHMKLEQKQQRDARFAKFSNNTTTDRVSDIECADVLLARTESLKQLATETADLINSLSSDENGGDCKWNGDMINSLFIAIPEYGTLKTDDIQANQKTSVCGKQHFAMEGRSRKVATKAETAHTKCPIKSTIPDDLVTGKVIFESIEHLKMVQEFICYLKKNPELPKPKYLVDCNLFSDNNMDAVQPKISFYHQLFGK